MQQIAAGDESAVAELYDRFGGLVFRVARQLLPTQAEAEDAVQEIFVRLWQTADRFDPQRAKLVTWVMLIARRHLIDQLRRKSVRPKSSSLEHDALQSLPQGAVRFTGQEQEQSTVLQRCLADLPELQRVVIERSYLQGFTLREVSRQLDAPLGTVKSALSRGLQKLRDRATTSDFQEWAAS
ncbi:MAG: sigma-70 family RNA polymerase sigma factor [Phycisphaerales bacterium]|nr:sigma-70 family RNA polymerase sigma factor [Phycisphaerales bacterium]